MHDGYTPVASPDIVGGVLYASLPAPTGVGFVNGSTVYAIDVSTGDRVWSRFLNGGQAGMAVLGNDVFVSWSLGGSSGLYALNTSDGSTVWKSSHAGANPSAPSAAGSLVYVNFSRPPTTHPFPAVCAFHVADGSLAWCHQVPLSTSWSLIVNAGTLFDTGQDGVVAVNASTGKSAWTGSVEPSTVPVLDPGTALFLPGTYNHARQFVALNVATGAVLWSVPMGQVYAAPVVSGTTVYVSTIDGVVHALRVSNGSAVWTATTDDSYGASLLVDGGTVYAGGQGIGTGVNDLMALDGSNGDHVWQVTPAQVCGTNLMTVLNGMIVTGNATATCGFDALNGNAAWVYPLIRSVPGAPAVVGNTVYAGSGDTRIYALDASTGTTTWTSSAGGPVLYSPAVAGGSVLAVANDSGATVLDAVDSSTGHVLWSKQLLGVDTTPVGAGNTFYIATNNGNVFALNSSTGATIWKKSISPSPGENGGLAVANGVVYVSWERIACGCAKGSVTALREATGHSVWSASLGGGGDPLAVSGGVVYVAAGGYIWARNAGNGKGLWKHKVKDYQFLSVAAGGGSVYAGASKSGNVYALSAAKGKQRWVHKLGGTIRTLAVDGGVVFAGANHATALNVASGHVLWSSTASDGTAVTATSGQLFAGTLGPRYGGIYRLNETNGHVVWTVVTAQSPL